MGWEPRRNLAVRALRVAFADFSTTPWQGFEKSERGPNNSSLFQPLAAVVVVAVQVLLSAVTAKGKLPCGMLATVMNALAVSDKLEQLGVPTEVFTSITMPQVAQPFTRKDALRAMDEGKIAVFGGGTGNPFFSTDTATALRAVEVSADVMFKATMVDGVYDKDPHKYADAKKYDTLTFTKVLEDQLAVMDGTAATLCRDNKLPILVFDLADPDNIARAVQGENVGTLVYEG